MLLSRRSLRSIIIVVGSRVSPTHVPKDNDTSLKAMQTPRNCRCDRRSLVPQIRWLPGQCRHFHISIHFLNPHADFLYMSLSGASRLTAIGQIKVAVARLRRFPMQHQPEPARIMLVGQTTSHPHIAGLAFRQVKRIEFLPALVLLIDLDRTDLPMTNSRAAGTSAARHMLKSMSPSPRPQHPAAATGNSGTTQARWVSRAYAPALPHAHSKPMRRYVCDR